MLILALALLLQDPLADRRAFEAAIAAGDEKALEAAAKTSERAKLALAEVRAHKRFGDAYPPLQLHSFNFDDKPFEAAMAELSKTLGFRPEKAHDPHNPLAIRTRVTFRGEELYPIEALERFSRWANLKFIRLGETLLYYPGARADRSISVWRHFAVMLSSFQETETLTSDGKMNLETRIGVTLETDSRVRVAGLGALRVLEILDDNGTTLRMEDDPPSPTSGVYAPIGYMTAGARLRPPLPACKELSIFRGIVEVLIPENPRVDDLPVPVEKAEVSWPNVTFQVVRMAPGEFQFQLTGRVIDLKKPYVWPAASDFVLVGRDGRVVESKEPFKGKPDAIVGRLTFDVPKDFQAVTIRVRSFASYGTLEIPFEFRGVSIR